MTNMAYCRFENTVADMRDCIKAMDDFDETEASEYEIRAYKKFIELCHYVAENYERTSKGSQT